MSKVDLTCLLFPDLFPWERESVQPILAELGKTLGVRQMEMDNEKRGCLKGTSYNGPFWVVSRNWLEAMRFLDVTEKNPVFFSVFSLATGDTPLSLLFWKRFVHRLPRSVHLIAHSPLTFRFFREIEGLTEAQISLLPLPFSPTVQQEFGVQKRPVGSAPTVGVFAPFLMESNLHYFLNVAHYLLQKQPALRLKIIGNGPLRPHLVKMIQVLGLGKSVEIVDTVVRDPIGGLDVMLYVPLRNDHFLPVLLAGAAGVPALCSEIPGIQEFITDGQQGYVLPVHETKPMAELILRLVQDAAMREGLGSRLQSHLSQQFSAARVSPSYSDLFFHAANAGTSKVLDQVA